MKHSSVWKALATAALAGALAAGLAGCGSSSSTGTSASSAASSAASTTISVASIAPGAKIGSYTVPEGKLVTKSAVSGNEFIYNMKNLYVVPGYDKVWLDNYEFQLSVPATAGNGDVYLALSDLAKVYGPDFKVTQDGNGYTVSHAGLQATATLNSAEVSGTNGTFKMNDPVKQIEGEVCVPALEFMGMGFGKYVSSQDTTTWDTSAEDPGTYQFDKYQNVPVTLYSIGNTNDLRLDDSDKTVWNDRVTLLKNQMRGAKDYGISYRAFYDERVDKCITTQLYVPTTLYTHPDESVSAMVLFPGAGGTADTYNTAKRDTNMDQTFQKYAEEQGYVLITVESYIKSGQYGDPTGPIGRFPVTNPDDPANPWGKSEGWLSDIQTSGEVVIDTLDYAEGVVPAINQDQVFAVGVSMGSMGAFSMGVNYPDRFAGLVGTAGITEIDHWDVASIGSKPFLFIGGTEDANGLDYLLYGVEKLDHELPNFDYIISGGAVHGNEWHPYAQDIFTWCDKIIGKSVPSSPVR